MRERERERERETERERERERDRKTTIFILVYLIVAMEKLLFLFLYSPAYLNIYTTIVFNFNSFFIFLVFSVNFLSSQIQVLPIPQYSLFTFLLLLLLKNQVQGPYQMVSSYFELETNLAYLE